MKKSTRIEQCRKPYLQRGISAAEETGKGWSGGSRKISKVVPLKLKGEKF